jgi:ketosteroid isomerase-like protein
VVGIFWLLADSSDIFSMTSQSLEEGEKYGDWIIAADDHVYRWDALRAAGDLQALPLFYQEDYFYLPRGRVSFNTKQNTYYVYHGNWFRKDHKKLLCERYGIEEADTVFEADIHYTL